VPFTFVATVAAIEYARAKPVFVDIEPTYLTMDPAQIERVITPRTKAIVPVHLYGQPADMDPILALADRRGLAVIEDACQAHGSEYKGRRCGSMGRIGCFSFYPGKNLGAYGEGGAIVTSDPAVAEKTRLLRSWGEETRYEHKYRGFNYRMDGVQGAVLDVKLKHLDAWTDARRSRAAQYARRLSGTAAVVPSERPGSRHVYHQYVVRVPGRDAWRATLGEAGIQTGVHYPIPVHRQPYFQAYVPNAADLNLPVTNRLADEVLAIPVRPNLADEELDRVINAICEVATPPEQATTSAGSGQ